MNINKVKNDNTVQRSMSWSLLAEIGAKFITPVTNMILARILVPEDFGVLAVCNMLISFMDIITDAGFGKYLIQKDFESDIDKYNCANVAFWSNLTISSIIVLIIILGRKGIAILLGDISYSTVIAVASIQLLFTSMSSIQTGLLRRSFKFKKLFVTRITTSLIPLLVTVPLAWFTKSYWSLIIGNISGAFFNAVILSLMSSWKPRLFYSFMILKKMFNYSFWSLCEGMANWAIFWVDTFIISNSFTSYYVGLYKNSSNMVISILGMISASMSPVLLSVLSRVKTNKELSFRLFLAIQRIILYLVIPMGLGLFCYRHLATYILFGNQWDEASNIVGAWGLMMMCSVIFYNFTAELYKSNGIPKILFVFQCAYLAFLIPICYISAHVGFWYFVYIRCACIIIQIILSVIFLRIIFQYSIKEFISNMTKPFTASLLIVLVYVLFYKFINSYFEELALMLVSILLYFIFLFLFFRKDILNAKSQIQNINL